MFLDMFGIVSIVVLGGGARPGAIYFVSAGKRPCKATP